MKPIFASLLAHYRRHPAQALFLLLGVVMANVLLVGTQVINAQARASYAEGERILGAGPVGRVVADGEAGFSERVYLSLRRAGFHELAPLLRRVALTEQGQVLELLGVDGLAMPRSPGAGRQRLERGAGSGGFSAFSYPPFELWAAPARLHQLGVEEGGRLLLEGGERTPPLVAAPDQGLGHRLLLDIGALQDLTDSRGQLTALLVFGAGPERVDALRRALPPDLRFEAEAGQPDPAALTRSFHLNLAAMGLLAFVVGVFLVYNALAFSYTDRRVLLRRLRLAGVSRRRLGSALLLELGGFLVLGGLLGGVLGAWLAGRLIPGVGQTLAQLYGVYIRYPDGVVPAAMLLPLLMGALAGILCAVAPMRRALEAPLLERAAGAWGLTAARERDRTMAVVGLGLLLLAAIAAHLAGDLAAALAGMAALLLGAALLLPWVLRVLLGAVQRRVPPRRAAWHWLLADSRWLLGPASVALMAVTLALVANNGLNTMIGSFRVATDRWLDQRLTAELYLRETVPSERLRAWLDAEAPGARVAERHRIVLERPNVHGTTTRVEVVDLPDASRFLDSIDLIVSGDGAREAFRRGEGLYVSERAWRLDGWAPGQALEPCPGASSLPVLGVYHDYGNPVAQWMLPAGRFAACWPAAGPVGQAIFGPDSLDWATLASRLPEAVGLEAGDLVDQQSLRGVGLAVFDRTFAVTRALNLLTLLVAGIGIFCAVSAIHHHRVDQQALLAALGIERRQRGALLLLQWGLLGLLSLLFVWPFGTVLAAYLSGVVTPVAFGWSFPLVVEAVPFLVLAGTAVLCLLLAVLVPSLRLLRASPGDLLRRQSV